MISSLFLEQFRSYDSASFVFNAPLTIIEGENGKGKTNILEAISALAFIKPFRSAHKDVFIMHNAPFARVRGGLVNGEELEIFWGKETKKSIQLKKNGVIYTPKEYLKEKTFSAVLFSPEDLTLPFLSPQYRRNFLSRTLSSLFPEYFINIMEYKKVLKHRNTLIKKYNAGLAKKEEFVFWDRQMAFLCTIISEFHTQFFSFINTHIQECYSSISGKKESVYIQEYKSIAEEADIYSAIASSFQKDIARGSTCMGVHRDDFSFLLRGRPVEESASRGETRSVILAFKKAEQMFIKYHTGENPILLLDDVFSELDHAHQLHLLSFVKNSQCIITTTEVEVELPFSSKDVQYIKI